MKTTALRATSKYLQELNERLGYVLRFYGISVQECYINEKRFAFHLLDGEYKPALHKKAEGHKYTKDYRHSDVPYWAFIWAGGFHLAYNILSGKIDVKGKHVVDFGCGSGVVGIAALKAGAKSVCFCDTSPNALFAAKANVHLAFPNKPNVFFRNKVSGLPADMFDIVLGSAIDYDKEATRQIQAIKEEYPKTKVLVSTSMDAWGFYPTVESRYHIVDGEGLLLYKGASFKLIPALERMAIECINENTVSLSRINYQRRSTDYQYKVEIKELQINQQPNNDT